MNVHHLSTLPECRPIPGCATYFACIDGRIFSTRKEWGHSVPDGCVRELVPVAYDRYCRVCMHINGVQTNQSVHRLILETFIGPAPDGFQAMHLDNNPTNNRLDNLRWGSAKENNGHKLAFGTEVRGVRNGRAKLTAEQVLEIRARLKDGASVTELAREYGVWKTVISKINHRLLWKHI